MKPSLIDFVDVLILICDGQRIILTRKKDHAKTSVNRLDCSSSSSSLLVSAHASKLTHLTSNENEESYLSLSLSLWDTEEGGEDVDVNVAVRQEERRRTKKAPPEKAGGMAISHRAILAHGLSTLVNQVVSHEI